MPASNHYRNNKHDGSDSDTIIGDGSSLDINATRSRFKTTAQGVVNSLGVVRGINEGVNNRVVLTDDALSQMSGNSLSTGNNIQTTQPVRSIDSNHLMINMGDPLTTDEMAADRIETATADVIVNEYPVDCFPDKWYDKCPWCLEETPFFIKWKDLRYHSYNLVENKYFETICITLILLSSMTLVSTLVIHAFKPRLTQMYVKQALEDVHLKQRKWLQDSLVYIDKFFTIIFLVEMLLKWFAYGFKAYFSNAWCWLDFVIVMVSP